MIRRICALIVFALTTHCLHAQQTVRKDTCQTIPKQKQTKPVELQDSTKQLTCPMCKRMGTVVKEVSIVPYVMPKKKKKCKLCGNEYLDNIRHFHVECSLCRGKGYLRKDQ